MFSNKKKKIDDESVHLIKKDNTIFSILKIVAFVVAFMGAMGGYLVTDGMTDSIIIKGVVALFWGGATLCIEWLMLTIPTNGSIERRISLAVFRIILSIFVSLTITESIITNFIYKESIDKILKEEADTLRQQRLDDLENKLKEETNSKTAKINTLKDERTCLLTLYRREKNADNKYIQTVTDSSGKICGTTSGEGGTCGDDCKQMKNDIALKEQELNKLELDLSEQTNELKREIKRISDDKSFPNDKPARDKALTTLKEENSGVFWSHFFLASLMIAFEMLIVMTKLLMPKLSTDYLYDIRLESYIKKRRLESMLKTNFDIEKLQLEYDTNTNLNKIKLTAEMTDKTIEETMYILQNISKNIAKYKKEELSKLSLLDLKSRKQVKNNFDEIEELYDELEKSLHHKFVSEFTKL
ncbi:MAG: DUF4407 domain-containing protein [Moraxellaceae bacterium]|nr:DUF4407 domain-containing protein [Moraxellaceae bacterium]